MNGRREHLFEFDAREIADAAQKKVDYHEARIAYWEDEYDTAVGTVERTIGAKVVKRPITDG